MITSPKCIPSDFPKLHGDPDSFSLSVRCLRRHVCRRTRGPGALAVASSKPKPTRRRSGKGARASPYIPGVWHSSSSAMRGTTPISPWPSPLPYLLPDSDLRSVCLCLGTCTTRLACVGGILNIQRLVDKGPSFLFPGWHNSEECLTQFPKEPRCPKQ